MNESEKAYAAGLIDGEGSVLLTKHHHGIYRCPSVSMTSTTPALTEFMKRHFGGSIRHQKVYKPHHKAAQVWSVLYDDALRCLELVRPFMLEPEKCRRTDLLLNRYKSVVRRNGKYDEIEKEERLRFEDDFFLESKPLLVEVEGS